MNTRRVQAADGIELALHRIRAYRDARRALLLVHGVFSNHRVWLHGAGGGLAHFLGTRGWDVWLADLRHHGASAREPRPRTWRFEDWILHDTPALVARVKEETDGAPLAWLGHSAGGVLAPCWLGRLGSASPLAAIVTFGTPGPGRLGVRRALAWGSARMSHLFGRFPARALRMGPEDEAALVLGDWMDWNARGSWRGGDGFDYLAALSTVRTPLLSVAGDRDRLFAPAEACAEVVERLGTPSDRKELAEVGPGLDHRGMLVSPRAREECWPRVAVWLETLEVSAT